MYLSSPHILSSVFAFIAPAIASPQPVSTNPSQLDALPRPTHPIDFDSAITCWLRDEEHRKIELADCDDTFDELEAKPGYQVPQRWDNYDYDVPLAQSPTCKIELHAYRQTADEFSWDDIYDGALDALTTCDEVRLL